MCDRSEPWQSHSLSALEERITDVSDTPTDGTSELWPKSTSTVKRLRDKYQSPVACGFAVKIFLSVLSSPEERRQHAQISPIRSSKFAIRACTENVPANIQSRLSESTLPESRRQNDSVAVLMEDRIYHDPSVAKQKNRTYSDSQQSMNRGKAMKFAYGNGDKPLEGFTIKRGVGAGGFGEVYFAINDAGKKLP